MDKVKRTNSRPFTIVYNDFLDSEGLLSTGEKLLLILLMRYGEQAFPSIPTMAHKTGLSKSTIQRTVDSLIEKGFLSKEGRKNPKDGGTTSNIYTIIDRPDVWTAKTPEEAQQNAQRPDLELYKAALEAAGYIVLEQNEKPVTESGNLSETDLSNKAPTDGKALIHTSDYSTEPAESQGVTATQPTKYDATPRSRERYPMDYLQEAMDYDALVHDHPFDRDTIDAILSVIYDAVNTGKEYLKIAGEEKPAEVVRSKLLKLDFEVIDYVRDLYQKQTQRIEHPIPWLLTVLYNAREQMGMDITNQVHHDFGY